VHSLQQGDEDDFAAAQMSKAISRNRAGGTAGPVAAPAAAGRPGASAAAQQASSILDVPVGGYGLLVQQQAEAAAKALQDAVRRMQLGQKQSEQNLQRTSANLQVGQALALAERLAAPRAAACRHRRRLAVWQLKAPSTRHPAPSNPLPSTQRAQRLASSPRPAPCRQRWTT
jgi:hypothetical protein